MKTVLVPLADGCEELEAITITDILTRAGASVTTAGLKEGLVQAGRGARLMPDTTLEAVLDQSFDLIVLPGGQPGADRLMKDERLLALLRRQNNDARPLAAVCAAPRALAAAGVLDQRRVTCYPGALEEFSGTWHNSMAAVEIDDHIVTGRGPGVALDFALALVEKLFDQQTRQQVETALAR